MGIKGLTPFLKKHSPESFVSIDLDIFYRRRIAIDSANWCFKYLKTSRAWCPENPLDPIDFDDMYRNLFDEMVKFMINLLNHHITPVWIWDGEAHPYKGKEKEKRREERQGKIQEREALKQRLLSLPPFERDEDEVKRYQKLLEATTYVPKEVSEKLHRDMKKMGIPSLIAPYEGETFGSILAMQRKVAGVWTADTDVLAIGCPLKLNGYTYEMGQRKDAFECVFLMQILEDLEMSLEQFRDLCIMCGCDFNDRIKGMGPANSFKLLKRHGSVDKIGEIMDITTLNVDECREMLWMERVYVPDSELEVVPQDSYDIYENQSKHILNFEDSIRNLRSPKDIGIIV